MSIAIVVLALILSLAAIVVGLKRPSFAKHVQAALWVGLGAACAAAFFGEGLDPKLLVGVSSLALMVGATSARLDGDSLADSGILSIALALPVLAFSEGAFLEPHLSFLVLAFAGLLAASLGAWTVVMSRRFASVLGATSIAGALVIGFARGAIGEGGYHLPLSSAGGPVYWEVPPMERLPDGIRLLATGPLPDWAPVVLLVLGILGLVAPALHQNPKARLGIAGLGALGAVVMAWVMATIRAGGTGPTEPYKEYARQILLNRQLPESVLEGAKFSAESQIVVDLAAVMPDLFLLTLAGAFFVLGGRGSATNAKGPEVQRAAVLFWGAWFVSVLFHMTLFGVPGIHSASEWTLLGNVLIGTSVALAIASTNAKISGAALKFGPVLVLVALILSAAGSWVFQTPFGLSLSL